MIPLSFRQHAIMRYFLVSTGQHGATSQSSIAAQILQNAFSLQSALKSMRFEEHYQLASALFCMTFVEPYMCSVVSSQLSSLDQVF